MPREIQDVQEQMRMLASVAIANDGTARNKRISKKVGRSANIKYTYTQHLFDFTCKSIHLKDKHEMDCLRFLNADVHIKIDDNLLVVTVVGRGGRMKVLSQLNATTIILEEGNLSLDSPSMYMEVR